MAQDVYHYRKKESGVVVIGNGMIAGAMQNVSGWNNDVIFSSGVSNSGEKNEESYIRELVLLNNQLEKLDQSSFLVYFSTISIYDTAKSGNSYILHKLNVEGILRSSNKNYIILRLPNLVGSSSNPNTLTNYFADRIRRGEEISLNRYAIRHLIDVDDLPFILNDVVRIFGKRKMTVNVETDKPLSAPQILSMLEVSMNKKAIVRFADKKGYIKETEQHYKTPSVNYFWRTGINYHNNLLMKYYSADL